MIRSYQKLIRKVKHGFKNLPQPDDFKESALKYLKLWLKNGMFNMYVPHIIYLINNKKWNLLLDSFFKVIPFGTGGRRGLVGIGPNRINICTVKISAQGFSQYLLKRFGNFARKKGIVLAYDVRESVLEGFSNAIGFENNSVKIISSYQLAKYAANIYAANGIKVYIFKSFRSTPVLSFTIKNLEAMGGCVFSASHNLSQYNGEKFYDHRGNQPIPPYDELIIHEIKHNVNNIPETNDEINITNNFIEYMDDKIDHLYYDKVSSIVMGNERNIKILYSPMHGTGLTSVFPVLCKVGFDVRLDKETSNLSGKFENIALNIPNPELRQTFNNLIANANSINADIIMSTDPDADRLGVMVFHENNWKFLDGHQIGIILTEYIIKNAKKHNLDINKIVIIKTEVTTSLIDDISKHNNVTCIGNLPIGFKYICAAINNLEKCGFKPNFLLGLEESNGYLVGNYCGDKDASGAAILIAELAAILKKENLSLIDYINVIYSHYGYSYNYKKNIILRGIDGIKKIDFIMTYFRNKELAYLGNIKIKRKLDRWEGHHSHLSKSDSISRNLIVFILKPLKLTKLIKLSIRPSGTEPKLKIYIEINSFSFDIHDIKIIKRNFINIRKVIEKDFLKQCYMILNLN